MNPVKYGTVEDGPTSGNSSQGSMKLLSDVQLCDENGGERNIQNSLFYTPFPNCFPLTKPNWKPGKKGFQLFPSRRFTFLGIEQGREVQD